MEINRDDWRRVKLPYIETDREGESYLVERTFYYNRRRIIERLLTWGGPEGGANWLHRSASDCEEIASELIDIIFQMGRQAEKRKKDVGDEANKAEKKDALLILKSLFGAEGTTKKEREELLVPYIRNLRMRRVNREEALNEVLNVVQEIDQYCLPPLRRWTTQKIFARIWGEQEEE